MKKKIVQIFAVIIILITAGCQESGFALRLLQLPNQTHSQMMSYVMQEKNGDIIVIDGGTKEDEPYLVEQILSLRPDGKVKAWYLTHYHKDHTGALAEYLMNDKDALEVEMIYYQFPDLNWIETYEPKRLEDARTIYEALDQREQKEIVHRGDVHTYGKLQVEVLRNADLEITENAGNNSSIVYKFMTENNSILFLGDLGVEAGEELLKTSKDKIEHMNYVQMAHHGQAGVNEEFYKTVDPNYCLWPATDWIWNNDDGRGPDSATLKTRETQAWIENLNVIKNYIAKDGLQIIDMN